MAARWIVRNAVLMIIDENGLDYFPSSQEIYYSVFGGEKPKDSNFPAHIGSLQTTLPDLQYSKIGSKLNMHLYIDNQKISGEVYITRNGKNYPVQCPTIGGPDHTIINGQWVYLSENYLQVASLLADALINDISSITFSSYIKVQTLLNNYPEVFILDQVKGNLESIAESLTDNLPYGLKANLYPYQSTGYKWLKFITDENCGCILGDEMGLGKTLQIIALLLQRKQYGGGPSLVVAPVSLLENWKREMIKFAPSLSVLVNYGSNRTGRYTDLQKFDVVVISYNSAISDLSMLCMIKWDLLILDEAQNIKNPNATRSKVVKGIPRRAGIAVTGTPFENHISDIWSIIDFSNPGFLGTIGTFLNSFQDNVDGAEKIEPILSSLMIRRRVADVAKDLPEKIIIPHPIAMSDYEAMIYEDERQNILASSDSKMATFTMLLKLRMYCTHPFLLENGKLIHADPVKASTKYSRLCELLEEIISANEKVILFTSFSNMFPIIKEDIQTRFNIPVFCINGSTPVGDRQPIIDQFSIINGSSLLVLNPRAAGTGLNITAANHVIHYNLEWNPALEDQSTARAYRRGQDKPVFVYRLYYVDTVEQFVNEKIEVKRSISDTAVIGTTGELDNRSEILAALLKSPVRKEAM